MDDDVGDAGAAVPVSGKIHCIVVGYAAIRKARLREEARR